MMGNDTLDQLKYKLYPVPLHCLQWKVLQTFRIIYAPSEHVQWRSPHQAGSHVLNHFLTTLLEHILPIQRNPCIYIKYTPKWKSGKEKKTVSFFFPNQENETEVGDPNNSL